MLLPPSSSTSARFSTTGTPGSSTSASFRQGEALDAFLRDVVTTEWHFQHDAGRPFAETSAELIQRFPNHAELIAQWGPRFNETIPGPVADMPELVAELDAADVPLFAITNFSGEFWTPFRAREAALFDRFRDIVVSGDEKLIKPDPAIYRLALKRFGLETCGCGFRRRQCGEHRRGGGNGDPRGAVRGRTGVAAELRGLGLLT